MRSKLNIVLNELGILLIPPGIVSLFCQLLDISTQKTAAYSLTAMLLIVCCLHRSWINSKIPSAFLLASMLGLAAVFFLNYQNILLKDTGLIKRFKLSSDFQGELGIQIENADDEIWLFGTNFHISSVDRRKALLDKLSKGVKVRFLILDPFVAQINQIANDFDQPVSELKDECVKGLKNILELKKEWEETSAASSHPGELEVRFFATTPRARMYVFDPGKSSGRTLFVPYMNQINSPDLPGYLLENTSSGVFSSYFSGVQKLWQKSQLLDAFLKTHPDIK
jgi:hypothetical protein